MESLKLQIAVREVGREARIDKERETARKAREELEKQTTALKKMLSIKLAGLSPKESGRAVQMMRTPSPFQTARKQLETNNAKIGNVAIFERADEGRKLIKSAQQSFRQFQNELVRKREGQLAGVKINVCMEFSAINACFVLGLAQMGARVKWVSNDRHQQLADNKAVAQAVAVIANGLVEPYEYIHVPRQEPRFNYWSVVIRSLIWKKKGDETMEYADFMIDPDGILSVLLNEAVAYELKSHRPSTS